MENMVKSHKNTKSGLTRAEEEWIMVPLFKRNTKLTKASETHDRVSDAFFLQYSRKGMLWEKEDERKWR